MTVLEGGAADMTRVSIETMRCMQTGLVLLRSLHVLICMVRA